MGGAYRAGGVVLVVPGPTEGVLGADATMRVTRMKAARVILCVNKWTRSIKAEARVEQQVRDQLKFRIIAGVFLSAKRGGGGWLYKLIRHARVGGAAHFDWGVEPVCGSAALRERKSTTSRRRR